MYSKNRLEDQGLLLETIAPQSQLDIQATRKFLAALSTHDAPSLDGGDRKFWFCAYDDGPEGRPGPWGAGIYATLQEAWPKIEAANRDGFGIFTPVNEMSAAGRKTEHILRIRAVHHDDDTGRGVVDVAGNAAPLPPPGIVATTSTGKHHRYQIVSPCRPMSMDEHARCMAGMVRFNCDPNATGAARILRLPGTLHMKSRAHPHAVTVEIDEYQCVIAPSAQDIVDAIGVAAESPPTRAPRQRVELPSADMAAARAAVEAGKLALSATEIETLQSELNDNAEGEHASRVISALCTQPGENRDDWLRVGMILHHATGGGFGGEALWAAWAERASAHKFDGAGQDTAWRSFSGKRSKPVTLATLFMRAKKGGWIDPVPQSNFTPLDLAAPSGSADGWAEPDKSILQDSRTPAPRFPVEMLGEQLAPWTAEMAAAQGAPVDFLGSVILGIAAGFIGSTRTVSAGPQYVQPLSLWCLNVAPPSGGKSAPLRVGQAAVDAVEAPAKAADAEALRHHEDAKKAAAVVEKAWLADIAKSKGTRSCPKPPAADAPPPPRRRAMTFTGATLEALFEAASQTPRGMFTLQDELSAFVGDFDRYGGNGSDRANMLKAYDGLPFDIRRKGRAAVEGKLWLSIVAGIQPEKLHELFGGSDDGFAARFLMFAPDAAPYAPVMQERISDELQTVFGNLFGRLGPSQDGSAVTCPLSADALRLFECWRKEHSEFSVRLPGGKLKAAVGKQEGMVLRVAAVVQHLWWAQCPTAATPSTIGAKALAAACDFVEAYQKPMLTRVYGNAITPAEATAAAIARRIVAERRATVNVRELRRGDGWPGLSKSNISAAISDLEEAGWLRPCAVIGNGRPRGDYSVNPRVHSG